MRRNVQNSCFGLFCWSGAALLRDAQWSFDHYFCLLQSWASHLWVLRRSLHSCILCCTEDQLNQTIDFSTLSDIMKVVFLIIDTYKHNTYYGSLQYHVQVCYMLWTGMDRYLYHSTPTSSWHLPLSQQKGDFNLFEHSQKKGEETFPNFWGVKSTPRPFLVGGFNPSQKY